MVPDPRALCARSDDPWDTHASPYEQHKYAQTIACLPRDHYRCGLEVGCGAGGLTALLAPRCDALVAIDCTAAALAVAQRYTTSRNVDFREAAAPGFWSTQPPDLVVLSEVLYFFTDAESTALAERLSQDCAVACDVVLVNWSGDTGGAIGGEAAARRLISKMVATHRCLAAWRFDRFRIDILRHVGNVASCAPSWKDEPENCAESLYDQKPFQSPGVVASSNRLPSGSRK